MHRETFQQGCTAHHPPSQPQPGLTPKPFSLNLNFPTSAEPTNRINFIRPHPSNSNRAGALLSPRSDASRSLCSLGSQSEKTRCWGGGGAKARGGKKHFGGWGWEKTQRDARPAMPLTAEEALGTEVAGAEPQDRQLVQPGHHLLGEGQQPRQPLQLPVQPLPVPFGGVGGAAFGRPRPHPAGQSRVTGRRSLSRRVPPPRDPSPRPPLTPGAPASSACDPRTWPGRGRGRSSARPGAGAVTGEPRAGRGLRRGTLRLPAGRWSGSSPASLLPPPPPRERRGWGAEGGA